MEIEIKAPIKIEDGKHEGQIVKVDFRTTPYDYTDIHVKLDEKDKGLVLKVGYPTTVTEESKLGKLLMRFKGDLIVGNMIDPDILVGEKCTLQTITDTNSKFPKVIGDSLKPINIKDS